VNTAQKNYRRRDPHTSLLQGEGVLLPPTHTKMLFASQSKLQINVDCIFLREVTKHIVAN
jgi:hypothetical protein